MSRRRRERAARNPDRQARTSLRPRALHRPRMAAGLRASLHRLLRTHPLMAAAALAALHVLLGLLTFAPQPHTGGDNAAYIALGESLLQGTYTELWDPLTPPHTKYPPVFPGVLAVALLAGLKPWVQLKFVVLALSAVGVAFTFLWIRSRRRPLLALGIATILAVAPGVLNESRWILSDVPFWAFTMIALWAFERLGAEDWRRFGIAVVATLLAYFTRSAGLPLVLAAFAFLALRHHWKQLAVLAVLVGVPALLWWLRARAWGPSGYVSEFWLVDPYTPQLGRAGAGDLLQRIVVNASKYTTVHLPLLLAGSVGSFARIVSALTFVLAIGNWIVRVRTPRVADLFVPLYVGLIFIWPDVWSGERFLLPLLPLLLFHAGEALVRLTRRLASRLDFVFPAAVAILLIAMGLPTVARAHAVSRECSARYQAGQRYPCLGSPAWDELFEIAEAAGPALPDGAVVINRKPRLFYGLGGVRGSIYPFSPEPAQFFQLVDSVGARYVVLDRLGSGDAFLVPVVLRKPAAFCLMHARPAGTVLMGILPDHAAAEDLGDAGIMAAAATTFAVCDSSYWRDAEAIRSMGPR
jgi:hypothetical protein